MRIYHFLNAKYGLQAIKQRRLKASVMNDLNDPFDMRGTDLSDKEFRVALLSAIDSMSETRGLHCFSKNWSNPVLWSHYADKHRGLCLGFDVPDHLLLPMKYVDTPLPAEALLGGAKKSNENYMKTLLSVKFSHWEYEDEVRFFVSLEDKDEETGFFYTEFSANLRLVQVIVGCKSKVSRADILSELGDEEKNVERFKARAAFKSFSVVKNQNSRLWS